MKDILYADDSSAIGAEEVWKRLKNSNESFLREGSLIKFKTNHTAGNHYHYALAVRFNHDEDLSFVGLGGRTWGYGVCTLKKEARFEEKKCTVSVPWLLKNFNAIVEPLDIDDVWYVEDALDFVLSLTEDLE
ncbi:hypothetical protein [Parasedimentitalea marina]|nr:hypothetical protein [Parasedimentitalea marina]